MNPEDYIPEIQVQTVDHNFRVSGLTDDKLGSDPIFNIISSATSTLDIAVTRINRQEVVEALLDEANSGVQIRIVTEKAYYDDASYKPFYSQLEDATLNSGNITIHTDNEGLPRLMHARFLVIDQAKVVTGSYNWEVNTCEYTYGDVITILNTGVAAAFTNQFNQMFVEGNFGINKRNDTQHSFSMGGGFGLLEVYFGPTDQPRELLMTEVDLSANVIFAVQQFTDTTLANDILSWLVSAENNSVFGIFNDFGPLGDATENAIYNAFYDLAEAGDYAVYVNDLMDPTDAGSALNGYNTMNHKLVFTDHAYGGNMSVIFTTANFSDLGFTLNDEVMLIFRDTVSSCMVNKFWRGLDLTDTLPPDSLRNPEDVQEFDALFCLWPNVVPAGGDMIRDFSDVPCGIVYGEVSNFTPTVTISDENGGGDTEEIPIDLTFEMDGTLYWTNGTYEGVRPNLTGDIFEENEIVNPDHRFMLVVPAGEVTLRTIVISPDGSDSTRFAPDEIVFEIGPGCVREVKTKINQAGSGSADTGLL